MHRVAEGESDRVNDTRVYSISSESSSTVLDKEGGGLGTSILDESAEKYLPKFKGEFAVVPPETVSVLEGVKVESPVWTSDENVANRSRLSQYKETYSPRLLSLIKESNLEYGFNSELDVFLRDRLNENAMAAKGWLNELFLEHFANTGVATGILRMIAHFDYDEMKPEGPTIALAALIHKDAEVRECAIRVFENWCTKECLAVLRNVQVAEKWLSDYLTKVISDLEEELGE